MDIELLGKKIMIRKDIGGILYEREAEKVVITCPGGNDGCWVGTSSGKRSKGSK